MFFIVKCWQKKVGCLISTSSNISLHGKLRDFFATKLQDMKHQSTSLFFRVSIPLKALIGECIEMAHCIAEYNKPNKIVEELIYGDWHNVSDDWRFGGYRK